MAYFGQVTYTKKPAPKTSLVSEHDSKLFRQAVNCRNGKQRLALCQQVAASVFMPIQKIVNMVAFARESHRALRRKDLARKRREQHKAVLRESLDIYKQIGPYRQ